MKTLVVIYHSQTGGALRMAHAAADGAGGEADVAVRRLAAADTQPQDLLTADAYIFATPENLAAISGLMKDFFDRCYYPLLDRLNGRPYASLICAGTDGTNAARQIARIANGWRLKQAAEPLIVLTHAETTAAVLAPKIIGAEALARCETLGAAMAAGLAMGII